MNEARTKLGLPNRGRVEVRKFEIQQDRQHSHKPQRKKEGHDDLINRLRMRSVISITTMAGEQIKGILQESDRYTITVRLPEEGNDITTAIDRPDRILLVYKHAIESFYLTKLDSDE